MKKTSNDRVCELLKNLNLGPRELAKMMEKEPSTIYKIVNNETKPTKTTLKNISNATGASFKWLLLGEGPEMDPNPKNPAPAVSDPSSFEAAINALKTLLENQLAEKDKQIAGLMNLLNKVNFHKPVQKSGSKGRLLNLSNGSVLADAA